MGTQWSNGSAEHDRKWVERATAKMNDLWRPVLSSVREEPGISVATDGVRIHAINKGDRFPDWQRAVDEVAEKDGAIMTIDAALLHDALPHKGLVYLRIVEGGKTLEVAWGSTHTAWRYALIQGIVSNGPKDEQGNPVWPWRPASGYIGDLGLDEEE